MNKAGQIRRLRQALDQLRLAVDYVHLAATTLLDALELEAKAREDEPTQQTRVPITRTGGHVFRGSSTNVSLCQDCGHPRGHRNHNG